MLCWPALLPLKASSWLPGGTRRSASNTAALSMSSFRTATRAIPLNRRLLPERYSCSVSEQANDWIVTLQGYYATCNTSSVKAISGGFRPFLCLHVCRFPASASWSTIARLCPAHPFWLDRGQGLPSSNGADASPCLGTVGDEREVAAQLDHGREFTALL